MANVYRPKMKVDTARSIAQRMATTQQGKQVTAPAFKKFLRSDKQLQGITYRSGSTHITQQQAQKFIKNVAEKIHQGEKYKLSQYARKTLGIRPTSKDSVGMTGVKHAYQVGARQEVAAETPKGPSPEEVLRQKRIEKGRQILHQRDRADEVRKEYQQGQKGEKAAVAAASRPPQISGGTMLHQQGPTSVSRSPASTPTRTSMTRAASVKKIRTAILPVRNLSQMRELTLLAEKLEETIRRAVAGLPMIEVVSRVITVQTLQSLGWQEGRAVSYEFAKRIAKSLQAEYVFFGTVAHVIAQAHTEIFLLVMSTNSVLKVADVKEHYSRTFEIEKQIAWQIQNFFEARTSSHTQSEDVKVPSASEAIDIPI